MVAGPQTAVAGDWVEGAEGVASIEGVTRALDASDSVLRPGLAAPHADVTTTRTARPNRRPIAYCNGAPAPKGSYTAVDSGRLG
jgi:hypothetical protein